MIPIRLDHVDVMIDEQKILHDISFSVEKGCLLGLIGPNGSGKSTLLKTIATLLPAASGKVLIDDENHLSYSQKTLAKKMSYVPQETLLAFDFSARDVVAMGRHVYGSVFKGETKKDKERIEWAMKKTKTDPLSHQSVLNLSGGQRQLVMIAKALAQDTPIMLLDEPISALDVYYQLHILSLLKELCEQGQTMIVVLHDLNLAARFCHRLLLLNDGSIREYGTPEEVLTERTLKEVYHVQSDIRKDPSVDALTITPFI